MGGKGNFRYIAYISVIALAVFASFFAAAAARPIIVRRVIQRQADSAAAASMRQPSIFYAGGAVETRPKIGFASFGVPDSIPPQDEPGPASELAGDIANFKLVGTLPSAGAWIDKGEGASLVLMNAVLDGYALERIEYDHVLFSRDGVRYPVYMAYQSSESAGSAAQTRVVNVPGRVPEDFDFPEFQAAAPVNMGGIVQAGANGEDGTITRETLNELLMNPLDEIGRMRLVPMESGMMIMRMRRDSLFSRLGVQPRDVITNINGIAITDVSNVANVIGSMLSGTRFDVRVERDGQPVTLGYAVR